MADDWVDVPATTTTPAAPKDDGWQDVPAANSGDGWSSAGKEVVNSTPTGGIMRAFGQGFGEAWGPDRLGLSDDSVKWLAKTGVFASGSKFENPFQAFNEGIMVPAATALDAATRLPGALYRGAQSAVNEALGDTQFSHDLVSIPDAFIGSPGGLGEIRMRPGLPKHPETAPLPQGMPDGFSVVTEAPTQPKNAPFIEAYHGSPHDFDRFDLSKIGTGEGAQAYGHGLYFAEEKNIASHYATALSPSPGPIPEAVHGALKDIDFVGFDSAGEAMANIRANADWMDRWGVSDSEAAQTINKYVAANPRGNLYQVRINADPDLFLDWDKPLNEQPVDVQEKIKSAMGERFFKNAEEARPEILMRAAADNPVGAAERLRAAGIPGIRYLDQGSRGIDASSATRNYVVFNDDDIQITHKNGISVDAVPAGHDLGVIGPERPPVTEGTPEEAAKRTVTMPTQGPKGEAVTQEVGGQPNEWRQRFDQFVGKLNAPGDMQQLIKDAADQNEEFPAARVGDISLKAREDMASAAGVEGGSIDWDGVGRKLQNDNQVRNAMQAMMQATEQVKAIAREVKADGSPENLMRLQEAMLRRDQWVEQVVGHRAEWGRTGNVFQEFLQRTKEEEGFSQWLKDNDRSPEGLKKIADAVDQLDRGQAARFLSDMNKPTAWDKFKYYWVNSLISGPVTHTKYAIANTAFAGYESAAVTPLAGLVGAARRAIKGGNEGVYAGEGAARLWGLVAGVPDAMKAAMQAAKTGLQTPLPGELAQEIIPKQNKNITFQQRPIPGKLGAVIGLPSRGASAIHSFFNFMGYRASIEAQAYRAAAKEGLTPANEAFWQRRATMADQPPADMMNNAIEEGYRLTFINELGDTAKAVQNLVKKFPPAELIMPFVHIPLNILRRAMEGTPFGFLDPEVRQALAGKQGAVKQDMAVARMIAGTGVGAWAVNMFLNGNITGFGPTDQKERAQWVAAGHQPYSVKIGNEWLSFNRFGPIGTMLGLYSNLAETIPHLKPDSEDLTKAIAMTVHSTGRLLEDEVGMQGLAGLMQAIDEPERSGARYISSFAGSLLPFSSAQRQIASAMDPSMREAKTVVDGLRYYVPVLRQGLEPKRDWLGAPMANSGYGGDLPVPGVSSLIQHRNAVPDPVAQEMATLDLKPAAPQNRIKGVKLTPELYDTYQATAGPFLRQILQSYINAPGWHDMPISVRQEIFRNAIKMSRNTAGAAMQMQYPQILQQAINDRIDQINGIKPAKRLQ